MKISPSPTVSDCFFAPLSKALSAARHRRVCHCFDDEAFLKSGIVRVLENVQSGRDWVQQLVARTGVLLSVGNFFEALKSPRRLRLSLEIAEHMAEQRDESFKGSDPLRAHKELAKFAVYAADGHYHSAASHDRKIDGKAQAVGHFFALNVRTHSMRHLDVARPKIKRENDITALKRLGGKALRMNRPKGTKVLYVYDCAIVDFRLWHDWKQSKGIYVITREQQNMRLEVMGVNDWGREDARNAGVLSDELVGTSQGTCVRRIRYRDAATETVYSFLTTEMSLPPGLIAFLYKMRWDIEKAFDETKNKFNERKAWASSLRAKTQQALFLCMAHNLMLLLERTLEREEGIVDEKCCRKRAKRMQLIEEKLKERGDMLNPLVSGLFRVTQRSLQFIRWLRIQLSSPTPWPEAVDVLRPLMKAYL